MRPTRQLELFRNEFLAYYGDDILLAEFDRKGNLIAFANPYRDFNELVIHMCDSVLDTVYFNKHIHIQLQPFGENQYVSISIN